MVEKFVNVDKKETRKIINQMLADHFGNMIDVGTFFGSKNIHLEYKSPAELYEEGKEEVVLEFLIKAIGR